MSGRTAFVTACVLAAAIVCTTGRACRAQEFTMGGGGGIAGYQPPIPVHVKPVAGCVVKKPILSAAEKAEAAILLAMRKPVDLEFAETPLRDAVKHLGKTLGVPIFLDRSAMDTRNRRVKDNRNRSGFLVLNEAVVTPESPVTFRESGISGRSALQLLLRQFGLAWTTRGEVLVITTAEEAERQVRTKVYDLADLLGDVDVLECESFAELMYSTIKPTTWDEVGGPGSISPVYSGGTRAVVVTQSREVHEEVAAMLAEIRRMLHEQRPGKKEVSSDESNPTAAKKGLAEKSDKVLSPEEVIGRALSREMEFDFVETPLADVVAYLRRQLKIPIQIDEWELVEDDIDVKRPVSLQLSGVSARSALELMLGQLRLDWIVRDEVLLITTPVEAELYCTIAFYDVTDLGAAHNDCDYVDFGGNGLCGLVTNAIQPTTWDHVGGAGSIAALSSPDLDMLIISQTRKVHEEIRKLLADLRAVRRLPPPNKRATKRGPVPGQHGYPIHGGYDVPPQLDPGMPDSHKGGGFF